MPIDDRDYIRGSHPPSCTCEECVKRRLENLRQEKKLDSRPTISREGNRSAISQRASSTEKSSTRTKSVLRKRYKIPSWFLALLLIFALALLGYGISVVTESGIPFWSILGLTVIYVARKLIVPVILLTLVSLLVMSTVSMVWPQGLTRVVPKQLEVIRVLPTTVSVAETEIAIFELVNQERVNNGLSPLRWDESLAGYARKHSSDMVTKGTLYHDQVELEKLGAGENALQISKYAGGLILLPFPIGLAIYRTDEELHEESVASWMGSPGHRSNMLNSRYKYTGVGIAVAEDNITCYMTQNFR